MKLARELSKRQTGGRCICWTKPTTGLHSTTCVSCLKSCTATDLGNSVIIIEHNLDVIRNADWILDLGPEGGEDGRRVVAQGRHRKGCRHPASYTGQFLARYYTSQQRHLAPLDVDDEPGSGDKRRDSDGDRGTEDAPVSSNPKPSKTKRPAAKDELRLAPWNAVVS